MSSNGNRRCKYILTTNYDATSRDNCGMTNMNDIAPEELPECTQALLDVLVPEEDLQMYAQVEERIQETRAARRRQLDDVQGQIKALSQTLQQLRAASTREAAAWKSASAHQDDMERLQAQNFDLVKRINEQEAAMGVVEADIAQLERDLAAVDETNFESQEEMDKDAIAVGLFRKMGFVPCYLKRDGTDAPTDAFQSLMVRSEQKGRSTELDVDDDMMRAKGITPYTLADQLWRASE